MTGEIPAQLLEHTESMFLVGESPSYHIQTRLADGRPAIIVDPGSVGILCGDKWAREIAMMAVKNGHKPMQQKRNKPLKVSGVGNGAQECHYDCTLPISIQQSDGKPSVLGSLTTPAVADSDLPGLLGLTALRKNRAVLDFSTLQLHCCGPGDTEVNKGLPPGTDSFQLEVAPSGHIVLPCCEFKHEGDQQAAVDHSLILLSRRAGSSGDRTVEATAIPPPPQAPPTLPETARREQQLPAPPTWDY